MGLLRSGVLGATKESFPLCRCPQCKKSSLMDLDMFQGRVSMECPNCGYRKQANWELLDSGTAMSPEYLAAIRDREPKPPVED